MGKWNGSIKSWSNIYNVQLIITKIIGTIFCLWQSFFYNNTMHLAMQQTPFFANHCLHPKFGIQGINNVMNPTNEDQVAWLVDIRTQLVSNLKEAQR
jgi:hypothetical protein